MDKKIKTILAVIVIAVVVVSALLFFVVFRDDKSKFIGTWANIEADNPNFVDQLSFFNNNSMRSRITIDEETYYSWSNYKINDSYLCYSWTYELKGETSGPFSDFFPEEEGEVERRVCVKYEFLENDQKLKLDLGEGVTLIFVKV